MSKRTVRYNLDKFTECSDQSDRKILAFTIRTTDGTDETHASKMAEKNGSSMTEELIAFSLVSYEVEGEDGKPALQVIDHAPGFRGFDKWSTKARNFAVAAWRKLSTPDEGDLASFFASATDVG